MMQADSLLDLMLTLSSSSLSINQNTGDKENYCVAVRRQHNVAAELLDMLGNVLDGADATLQSLERDPELLPDAIRRRCAEFADLIGYLARELEQQSPVEQHRLASADHHDIKSVPLQFEPRKNECNNNSHDNDSGQLSPTRQLSLPRTKIQIDFHLKEPQRSNGPLMIRDKVQNSNERNIVEAFAGVSAVFRDIETAFRDIDKDDAEEIAHVALTLARLLHFTLTPESLIQSTSSINPSAVSRTVVIEELSDCYAKKYCDVKDEKVTSVESATASKMSESSCISKCRSTRPKYQQRVRILWPPIGPLVYDAVGWTKEEAAKRPLQAVALGLTLWPGVVFTVILGGAAFVADPFLQDAYRHFQDAPLVLIVERGAASIYQAGKLTFITGKLAGKQTLRVVHKQIDRNGGVGPILQKVGQMAFDKVTHPVETVVVLHRCVARGIDWIKDTVNQIVSVHQEGAIAQALQP
jgi:hypothetical protein